MNPNVERLKQLFPEVVKDGTVDVDLLQELLGQKVDERPERFGLCWNGKGAARRLAQQPSCGTLRPMPEKSVNWDATQHLFIEGENLEVLKLLQKSYYRKVQLIYIDPPYNTGQEFIYPDKFHDHLDVYLRASGQTDHAGLRLSANSETSGRYHTNWLNMMYPRLLLARHLLRDDGVIFISIDDNECHHLRMLCDEVFGEENFQATIAWQKRYTRSNNTADFSAVVEYLHVYSRSDQFRVNRLPRTEETDARYANPDGDQRGPWKGASFLNPATPAQRPNLCYAIQNPNTKQVTRPTTNAWRRSKKEFDKLARENRLYWGVDGRQSVPTIKMFLSDARGLTPTSFWSHEYAGCTDDGTYEMKRLFGAKLFDNPKPVQLMKRILEHASNADSLVLDFFAGSCTLPQAVAEMNLADGGHRRFIAVQLPEACGRSSPARHAGYATIADVGRERIRRSFDTMRSEPDAAKADLGFRSLKLSSSNLQAWKSNRECLESSLSATIDNVKLDRSEMDVVFELLLHAGLDLSARIECRQHHAQRFWIVEGGTLVVCLDTQLSADTADAIVRIQQENPTPCMTVVLNDAGFIDDVTKANMMRTLLQSGIDDVKCLSRQPPEFAR